MNKNNIPESHNRNLSLKDMKILSLRNQKFISKSKIKFGKSSNENSSKTNTNLFTDNNAYSKNIKNYNQIKTKLIYSGGKKINLNLNLNININNYVDRSHSIKNHKIENDIKGRLLNIKKLSRNNSLDSEEPNENFDPEDFKIIKQIGEGSFGKIYCSEWKKNKRNYAMKKMILHNKNEIKKIRSKQI